MSAFEPDEILLSAIVILSIVVVVKVVAPDTPNVLLYEPVVAVIAANVVAPLTFVAPFICKASAIVTADESSALICVPANLIPEASTPPVPFGNSCMSSFDLADVILNPFGRSCSRTLPNRRSTAFLVDNSDRRKNYCVEK